MRTAELTGMLLDYWVARCSPACTDLTFETRDDHIVGITDIDGEKVACVFLHDGNVLKTMRLRRKCQMDQAVCYSPSKDWAQGGPLIESERIQLEFNDWHKAEPWSARKPHARDARGAAPLVAAMRCYVASKFGDEVPAAPSSAAGKEGGDA